MSTLPFHHSEKVVEEKNSFMGRRCKGLTDYWLENPALMLVVWLITMWTMAIVISSNGDRVYDSNSLSE